MVSAGWEGVLQAVEGHIRGGDGVVQGTATLRELGYGYYEKSDPSLPR